MLFSLLGWLSEEDKIAGKTSELIVVEFNSFPEFIETFQAEGEFSRAAIIGLFAPSVIAFSLYTKLGMWEEAVEAWECPIDEVIEGADNLVRCFREYVTEDELAVIDLAISQLENTFKLADTVDNGTEVDNEQLKLLLGNIKGSA